MKKMRKKFVFFAKVCMRLAIYVAFYALIANLKDNEKNICKLQYIIGWMVFECVSFHITVEKNFLLKLVERVLLQTNYNFEWEAFFKSCTLNLQKYQVSKGRRFDLY